MSWKTFIDRNKVNTLRFSCNQADDPSIAQLTQHGLNYIVGRRWAISLQELLKRLTTIAGKTTTWIKTKIRGYDLQLFFIRSRRIAEMNKQIEKAETGPLKISFLQTKKLSSRTDTSSKWP
ncbi:MAG: hypothetical protein U5K79_17635 [Cyclobacteriaceae bacterium]|nr:hypothetical protein [Cyclobacteriaceae bacterium]